MTMLTMGHLLNTQISPLAVGLGSPCPLYWKKTLSSLADLLSHVATGQPPHHLHSGVQALPASCPGQPSLILHLQVPTNCLQCSLYQLQIYYLNLLISYLSYLRVRESTQHSYLAKGGLGLG